MAGHRVTAAAVQVFVGSRVHMVERGSVLPEGVASEAVEHLVRKGLVVKEKAAASKDAAPKRAKKAAASKDAAPESEPAEGESSDDTATEESAEESTEK